MMWGYEFGWGWLLMAFGMVLGIALLVVLVWAAIRWMNNRAGTPVPPPLSGTQSRPTALEILQQRYARGEIDTATYEQMREQLQASDPRRSHYENQPTTGVP